MLDPSELRPKPQSDLIIQQASAPSPELSRYLYSAVGGDWYWLDRLPWSYDDWYRHLDRHEVETWVGYIDGTPAGYFELEKRDNDNVEIAYFGLMSNFMGGGRGGHMLSDAVRRAWAMGAKRVWVHTCNLDCDWARNNYESRGFKLCDTVVTEEDIPEQSPGPWPGARA